jgi:MFS family permease
MASANCQGPQGAPGGPFLWMKLSTNDTRTWFGGDRTLKALCFAAFLMSVANGIYLIALPFMIKRLGGTDGDVGLGMALNFGAYLVVCLATSTVIDRFNAKRLVQWGAVGIMLSFVGAACTVMWGRPGSAAIWTLNTFSALAGVLTAIFWPPMMGWVSTGYEKEALGHRLGSYNMSWSTGSWISPYLGGLLVGYGSTWPMATAAITVLICFAGIRFATNPRHDKRIIAAQEDVAAGELHRDLVRFRWMARVSLVTAFVCMGLMRSQLSLLMKFDLEYSEAICGVAIMILCASNFAVFTAAGRAHKWHYVGWLFWGSQAVTGSAMLMIVYFASLPVILAAAAIVGVCEGFAYVSHMFYGISGGRKRSGLMALHEFLLSVGFVIGSVGGGYISDAFGRRAPYWLGAGAILVGLAVQAAIWLGLRTRTKAS